MKAFTRAGDQNHIVRQIHKDQMPTGIPLLQKAAVIIQLRREAILHPGPIQHLQEIIQHLPGAV